MAEEIRETHVTRDAEGRVVDREVIVERPKKGGGFGGGMLFGVILIAGAIIAFAYSQGSFQQAGVEADQATAQIEQQTQTAVDQTGQALENAGDEAERLGDQAANERSETATN